MKRQKLILTAAFVATLAFTGGLFANGNALQASANTENPITEFSLESGDVVAVGASIRLKNDGQNGVRFPIRIDLDTYLDNADYIAKSGTLIIPADQYVAGTTELTVEGAAANNAISNTETTNQWFQRTITEGEITSEYAETLVYVYNVSTQHLDTDFYVCGYVTGTNGKTVYTDVIQRSLSYAADKAIKSGEYDSYISTLENYLASYTVDFDLTDVQDQTVKYGKTATAPDMSANELFLSWTADGATEFDFATEIKSNVSLTAKVKNAVALSGEYDVDLTNANETLKVANLDGTVQSISIDGTAFDATYANGVVKAEISGVERGFNKTVKITTDTTVYTLTASVWDWVVSNADELQGFINNLNANASAKNVWDYCCLDADIDASGVTSTANYSIYMGVWDGKGHSISGLNIAQGMMYATSNTGSETEHG